jgi:hypothetical protein
MAKSVGWMKRLEEYLKGGSMTEQRMCRCGKLLLNHQDVVASRQFDDAGNTVMEVCVHGHIIKDTRKSANETTYPGYMRKA